MKTHASRITAALAAALTLATASTQAATIYVSGGGSTLQTAINIASPGDVLRVDPGIYSPITTGNKAITIESTGGASVTIIDGEGLNRCATLGDWGSETNTVLTGFTLRNGWEWDFGGGAFGGTLNNCLLTGNTATYYGGGACGGTLNNCLLTGNSATYGYGGGAFGGTLNNCLLTGNSAMDGGGVYYSTLYNCTVTGNSAIEGGGAFDCILHNCTVTGNTATEHGGGVNLCYVYNSIVWGNVASCNHYNYDDDSQIFYSCTTPLCSDGTGNIGLDPMFVDAANGNYRLQAGSPCINKGNNSYAVGTVDLDGNPRIQGGTVDMGAYEYQGTTITTLQNGVPVTRLSDSTGSWRHYKIAVPAGATELYISMSGGTSGDADLYVRYGALPTLSLWDIRPYDGSGIAEMVSIGNPASGDWYISLHAYDAYSGVTLTATYTATSTYTVTFWPNGGMGTMPVQTFVYGVEQALSANTFTRPGVYRFDGWTNSLGHVFADSQRVLNLTAVNGANLNLYALWVSYQAYAVTFDAQGGAVTPLTMDVRYGTQFGPLPVPTRNGFTFGGWFTSPNGLGTQITADSYMAQEAPFTVYARWTQVSQAGEYIVIDLSGGTSAASYPYTTLTAVPAGGWTDEYKTTKLVLRKIPKGTFWMGLSLGGGDGGCSDPGDELHQVTLTQDFYIGVFEVTQRQWMQVMGSNPSAYTGDVRPVEYVSYDMIRGSSLGSQWPANNNVDATSFMGRIRAKTGFVFDLPTEAQWEYACRAGTTTDFNSGKNLTNDEVCPNMAEVGRYYGNRNDGKGGYNLYHTKVGSYLPNAWGLYDMHGNVWEWCLDWYGSYGSAAVTDPKGASYYGNDEDWRVLRGGSYWSEAGECRSWVRANHNPEACECNIDYGFRLCTPVAAMVVVTFDPNGGGTVSPANINVMTGQSYGVLPDPTRAGYTFAGWYTAATGGTLVTADTIVTQASAHTLYARWTAAVSLGDALKCETLTWTTSGELPWFAQSAVTRDGVLALQSGAIGHSQNSVLETTVVGPGTLTFWWRVSSEVNYDKLNFYIDSSEQPGSISGETAWTQKSFEIAVGMHTLKWSYEKNSSNSSGSDCGWLDEVTWTPATVTASPAVPTGVSASQGTYTDRVVVSWPSVSGATSYKVYRNTSNNSGSASQIGTPSSASYTDTDAVVGTTYYYWVKASNSSGDSGFSASAQGWRASGGTPPPEGPYLSDPEVTLGAAPFNTTAYNGFVYDGNKTVRGTLTLNAKVSKGVWTISSKVILQAATVSFSVKQPGTLLTDISLHKNGSTLTVRVEDNRVYGTLSGGAAGGTFTVDGARNVFAEKYNWEAQGLLNRARGLYNVALLSGGGIPAAVDGCADTDALPMGYVSLNVGNAGTVKLAGQLADGTKVSGSAKLLAGLNADGWLAAALYKPLYSKNGFIGGLLWIDPSSRAVRVDTDYNWFVDWKKPSSAQPDRLEVLGGYFGDGKGYNAYPVPNGLKFSAGVPDLQPLFMGGVWAEDSYPTGLSVMPSGQKLLLAGHPSGAKITYTAKTGVFKGSFKLYCEGIDTAKGKYQSKAASVSYSGVMVPDDGELIGLGTGTATINKVKHGIPVWIRRE